MMAAHWVVSKAVMMGLEMVVMWVVHWVVSMAAKKVD